ncbi:hypothetical protein CsSME_00011812 [Camellia sinensis var. sinensis]
MYFGVNGGLKPKMVFCIVGMDSTRTSPRTVARSARANVLADSQNVHKTVWDYESTQLFLQLIADEIVEGNRPFMVLSTVEEHVCMLETRIDCLDEVDRPHERHCLHRRCCNRQTSLDTGGKDYRRYRGIF